MGETIRIRSLADGFELMAYRVGHEDARRGGLVVIHPLAADANKLCERFAADGYEALAPDLFVRGSATPAWDQVQGDLQAVIDALGPPVFVIGYGWGGTAAWLAACRCDGLAAASAFDAELLPETPKVPIVLHYGAVDPAIPAPSDLEATRDAHPELPVHAYVGGEDAARLARLRTLALFTRHAGGRGEV